MVNKPKSKSVEIWTIYGKVKNGGIASKGHELNRESRWKEKDMSWRVLDDENGIGIERKLPRKLFC